MQKKRAQTSSTIVYNEKGAWCMQNKFITSVVLEL
jgi:hypothetical protein